MNIHHQSLSLQMELRPLLSSGKQIGFVPTMGALHIGHLSLVEKACMENDHVVVSIFVNPTQFDNVQDLNKYPRPIKEDISILERLNKNIIIFNPDASKLYGNNVVAEKFYFSGLENEMEGKHRAGHFDGVATVLNLLFEIIRPGKAYFGEKDFQQFQIVKELVKIKNLPIEVIGCPIVREKNGLAMSSRNQRLSNKEFDDAALIFKTLTEVNNSFDKFSISELNEMVIDRFSKNSLIELEYFEIANVETLKTTHQKHKKDTYRAFIAVFVGKVRLIDNIALN